MGEERAVVPVHQDVGGDASLAREMVDAYKSYVKFYQERMEKPLAEALASAGEAATDVYIQQIQGQTPDQVSWLAFNALAERDPALAQGEWYRLVDAARDELASGNRAARVIEGYDHSPWDRARFLVLRESFAREWQPANGVEWMLVDMLAQAFTAYEEAMKLFMLYTTMEASVQDTHIQRTNKWEWPRQSREDALTRAEQTLDRCQRAILRVQRALRDQRRYGPVIVQHAGQVNVGQQQVNVVREAEGKESGERQRRGSKSGVGKDRSASYGAEPSRSPES